MPADNPMGDLLRFAEAFEDRDVPDDMRALADHLAGVEALPTDRGEFAAVWELALSLGLAAGRRECGALNWWRLHEPPEVPDAE